MPPTLFMDLDATVMRNPFWSGVFPVVGDYLATRTGLPASELIAMLTGESARRKEAGEDAARAMDWDDIAQAVAGRLGCRFDLSIEQLVIDHCQPPHIAVLDQADDALRRVREEGWQIVAATHGLRKYQAPVLKALGLLPCFSDIAAPDSRHCLKSSRAFWEPYASAGEAVAHCGDLYEDDVASPKSFGIAAIWKTHPPADIAALSDPFLRAELATLPALSSVRPDALILHLAELPSVLAQIVHA